MVDRVKSRPDVDQSIPHFDSSLIRNLDGETLENARAFLEEKADKYELATYKKLYDESVSDFTLTPNEKNANNMIFSATDGPDNNIIKRVRLDNAVQLCHQHNIDPIPPLERAIDVYKTAKTLNTEEYRNHCIAILTSEKKEAESKAQKSSSKTQTPPQENAEPKQSWGASIKNKLRSGKKEYMNRAPFDGAEDHLTSHTERVRNRKTDGNDIIR